MSRVAHPRLFYECDVDSESCKWTGNGNGRTAGKGTGGALPRGACRRGTL